MTLHLDVTSEFVDVNGLQLHVAVAGPEDGRLVILLHGAPDFWYGWRHQIKYLAEQGYRVLAPDLRGFNLSDKPKKASAYNVDATVDDVLGILDWAEQNSPCQSESKPMIVGHDWGAVVAWWAITLFPERFAKAVIVNIPHPLVMRKLMKKNIKYALKFSYFALFQVPKLPEILLPLKNYKLFTMATRGGARRDAFTKDDIKLYRKSWSQQGAIKGIMNWYRGMLRYPTSRKKHLPITIPVHIVWGKRDPVSSWEMAEPCLDICSESQLTYFDKATHWPQQEFPERMNQLLYDFFEAG